MALHHPPARGRQRRIRSWHQQHNGEAKTCFCGKHRTQNWTVARKREERIVQLLCASHKLALCIMIGCAGSPRTNQDSLDGLIRGSMDYNMVISSKMISRYTIIVSDCLYWQYIGHISNFCMVTGFESILGPLKNATKYVAMYLGHTD